MVARAVEIVVHGRRPVVAGEDECVGGGNRGSGSPGLEGIVSAMI